MGVSDRSVLGLVIEASTVGEREIQKLTEGYNRFADSVEKHSNRVSQNNAKASDSFKRVQTDIEQTMSKVQHAIENPLAVAGEAAKTFAGKYGSVGIAVAGVTAAVGAGALMLQELVNAQSEAAEQSLNFAERLNITVGEGQRLSAMARVAGVDIGFLEAASTKLAAALEDQGSKGDKARNALASLGIATRNGVDDMRDVGAVTLDAVKALAGIEDAGKRAALGTALLGRGFGEIVPLIRHYKDLEAAVRAAGVGIDEAGTRKLADFNDQIDLANEKWGAFKQKLAAKIAPIEITILERTGSLVDHAGGLDLLRLLPSLAIAATGGHVSDLNSAATTPGTPNGFDAFANARNAAGLSLRGEVTSRYENSPEGQKDRVEKLKAESDRLRQIIGDSTSSGITIADASKRLDANDALLKRLQEQITERERLLKLVEAQSKAPIFNAPIFETISPGSTLGPPGLVAAVQKSIDEAGKFNLDKQDTFERIGTLPLATLNKPGFGGLPGVGRDDVGFDSERFAKTLDGLNERRVDGVRRALSYETELAGLISGPGGELTAVNQIAAAKIDAAEREFEITKDRATYESQVQEAGRAYTLETLRIQEQQLTRFQDQARGVFRALLQGQGGIQALLKSTGTQFLEQIFVNASGSLFKGLGGALGRAGGASGLNKIPGLGGLLKGTLFDPANGQGVSVDRNTLATDRNTLALERITSAGAGGGGTGSILSGVTNNPLIFRNDSSVFDDFDPATGKFSSAGGPSRWAKALGIGGALAGGAFGVVSGVKEGGLGGAATAGAAASSATAGILMAAGATGPLAPILLGVGLGLGFIKSFLGDPKEKFAADQESTLNSRKFTGVDGQERFADVSSSTDSFDTDFKGRTRVQQIIHIQIDALDAKSLESRAEDIAKIVGDAARSGNPDLQIGINQVVFGPGVA